MKYVYFLQSIDHPDQTNVGLTDDPASQTQDSQFRRLALHIKIQTLAGS
jgi:hypothetical protein